jgi:hypothetical protein
VVQTAVQIVEEREVVAQHEVAVHQQARVFLGLCQPQDLLPDHGPLLELGAEAESSSKSRCSVGSSSR